MKITGKCNQGVTEAGLSPSCAAPALIKPSSGNGSERSLKGFLNLQTKFTT